MRRPPQSHVLRNGEPKIELTREEAIAEAKRLADEDLDHGVWKRMPSPYECREGGHWHVGNYIWPSSYDD